MAVDKLGRIYVQDIHNERLEALKLKKVFKPPSIQGHCPPWLWFYFLSSTISQWWCNWFCWHVGTHVNQQTTLIIKRVHFLLHETTSFGSTKIAKFIVDHFPFLFTKKNILEDSAIDMATKSKHLKILKVLINSSTVELQMRNSIGNIALHESMFFFLFIMKPSIFCSG